MTDYLLFPTEALLLGECLGEYERGDGRFLDYLRLRVLPMMPSLLQSKSVFGVEPADDTSRRSLVDRVVADLGDSLMPSELEKKWGLEPDIYMLVKKLTELRSQIDEVEEDTYQSDKLQRLFLPPSDEDRDAIICFITDIAKPSEYHDLFQLGRKFGNRIAECSNAIGFLAIPDLYSGSHDEFFKLDDYVQPESLSALGREKLVCARGVAHDLLAQAAVTLTASSHLDLEDPEERESAVKDATAVSGALWLAFGEMLGLVREADSIDRDRDASSAVPRSHGIMPGATRDDIVTELEEVEKWLNDERKNPGLPERVIRTLGFSIEVLARLVWPSESDSDSAHERVSVGFLLVSKLQATSVLERRFASTAISLYKSYRNPAEHAAESFSCNLAEARFFHAGIRNMVELSRTIQKERENK